MKIERVLVVGLGAVGATIADHIRRKGISKLCVFAQGERAERLERDGLIINGETRHFTILDGRETVPQDLIIIATKDHDLPDLLPRLSPFVGPDSILLSLVNGISSEAAIAKLYGTCPLAMILGISALREGNRIDWISPGVIHFGEEHNRPSAHSKRVNALEDFFTSAAIPHTVPEDMLRALWYKFMINVGINQASAVLKAPYGVFVENQDARDAMEIGMREVLSIARKRGIDLGEKDLAAWRETLKTLDPQGRTSMLQDILAGRSTEVDIFAGEVIRQARALGLAAPVNELYRALIRAQGAMNELPPKMLQ